MKTKLKDFDKSKNSFSLIISLNLMSQMYQLQNKFLSLKYVIVKCMQNVNYHMY